LCACTVRKAYDFVRKQTKTTLDIFSELKIDSFFSDLKTSKLWKAFGDLKGSI